MGAELHVAITGNNASDGGLATPLRTISAAAEKAQPGDVITVHEGVYRERINPPRGGTSDDARIVYQAAPGEHVVIKGSERVTGWKHVEDDTWMVRLSNSFFGDFNPYRDVIRGDWYESKQAYHTGAVYVDGHWLKEAAYKSHVVEADDEVARTDTREELMNIEVLRSDGKGAKAVRATSFSGKSGEVELLELPDGKEGVGRMKDGDWLAYDDVDFGEDAKSVMVHTASPVAGGLVEVRRDSAEGELLGTIDAGVTAEWHTFQQFRVRIKALSGKHRIVLVFKERPRDLSGSDSDAGTWFAEVDDDTTTIWAQFKGGDPDETLVEINVRQSVFYPAKTGINYITVRGFTLEQAATPWSPPTAEQIGLLGVNWSKGWVIENNTIRYAACTGITLGKHGDEFDNTYNYNRSIDVGVKRGWSKERIGGHVVRNNHILHCGQGGINGSLGCSFSTITGNEIHEIRQHHQYGGCETAGIKLHGAIDVVISHNHIYRCQHWGGIWLDWMAQGARVTGNLLHDNSQDLMFEVNHGPHLVDNNIALSGRITEASGGGAYVHNLGLGRISIWPDQKQRFTPYFKPHSTDIIDKANVDDHDERFYNNLFVGGGGTSAYDEHEYAIRAAGNVFLLSAKPSKRDVGPVRAKGFDPGIKLEQKNDGWWLEMSVDPAWQADIQRPLVTSDLLGKATVPDAPFENRDGTPYRIDTDYFGKKRSADSPMPGPFRLTGETRLQVKVWPKE
jgi:alpha-N-arabinofuranosidase